MRGEPLDLDPFILFGLNIQLPFWFKKADAGIGTETTDGEKPGWFGK
jgi:hypothetical protein